MSEAEILFERRGAAGIVTLNRPKALNALNRDMCLALKPQLEAWAVDPAVALVVIKAAGEKAFCAGGDIRALHDSGKARDGYAEAFYADEYRTNARIAHFPKPYIALLDGIVMGGGVGLSVHGSHRVIGDRVLFAMPETGIGLFPDVGGSHFLPRCPGQTGMYLGLTGARLKTADTLWAGVGTAFVPSDRHAALLDDLCALAPRAGKDAVDAVITAHAGDSGPAPLADHADAIDTCFAAETVEGILDRLEALDTDWGRQTAAGLRAKSPISVKVTFRQIREGACLDFDDCMRMEYRLTRRFIAGHDFYEGVRAVIIDKDQAPKWSPDTLDQITDAAVDAYFGNLGADELRLDL